MNGCCQGLGEGKWGVTVYWAWSFKFGKMKKVLYNSVNVLSVTELHLKMVQMVKFVLYLFYHNLKNYKLKKKNPTVRVDLTYELGYVTPVFGQTPV